MALAPREARLQSAMLVPGRFAGRADLERRAKHEDLALALLRKKLGLRVTEEEIMVAIDHALEASSRVHGAVRRRAEIAGVATPAYIEPFLRAMRSASTLAERERVCAQHFEDCRAFFFEMDGDLKEIFGAELHHRLAVRNDRREARREKGIAEEAGPFPRVDMRQPGDALRVIALRRISALLNDRRFRRATHGHKNTFEIVEPGHEGVVSSTDQVWGNEVGLANTYKYPVKISKHRWRVSRALLSEKVMDLNTLNDGYLYLRPDLRVRQGAGTHLVEEHRTGPRGRWVAS